MTKRMAVIFKLICVRHGETEANKEQRIQGHLDIPLNKMGEAQAKEAGLYLNSIPFTRAYTSDLLRAKETCDNIVKCNEMPSELIKTDPRIRERNFGVVEGMLFKEALEMATAEGKTWATHIPPEAETLGQVQQRFVEFFKELCQSVYDRHKQSNKVTDEDSSQDLKESEPAEKILLVSHGAALKQLLIHFQKTLECEDFPAAVDVTNIPPNTSISEFVVKYSPRRYRLKCLRLYDTKHLDNVKCE